MENKYIEKLALLLLLTTFLPVSLFAGEPVNEESEIQKLDERITDVEIRSLADHVNIGLDMKIESTILNDKTQNAGLDPATGNTAAYKATSNHGNINSLLFRLNMDSKIGNRISVYASAESLSFFNDSFYYNTPNVNNREYQTKGEKLSITKAYFDWRLYENWVTFSAGRLPTTQGPPAHIKDGVNREGTYPTTAYSMPLDGFALTTKLSDPLEMKDSLILRLIYKPGGYVNSNYPQLGTSLGNPVLTNLRTMDSSLSTAMLEYEQVNPSHGLWNRMLAIVQYGFYKFGSPPAGYGFGPDGTGNNTVYLYYFDNPKFLEARVLSPYLEFNKIFRTQLDLYATATIDRTETFSNLYVQLPTGLGGKTSKGSLLHPGKARGTRLLTGARYEFPNKYFLGFEYMRAGENTLPTNMYTNNGFSTNYNNGNSQEVYLLKNMYNDNFIVRLGYTHLNVTSNLSANQVNFTNTDEKINVGTLSFNIKI